MRSRQSRTCFSLNLSCAGYDRCWRRQPPQRPKYAHGASTRSGDGVSRDAITFTCEAGPAASARTSRPAKSSTRAAPSPLKRWSPSSVPARIVRWLWRLIAGSWLFQAYRRRPGTAIAAPIGRRAPLTSGTRAESHGAAAFHRERRAEACADRAGVPRVQRAAARNVSMNEATARHTARNKRTDTSEHSARGTTRPVRPGHCCPFQLSCGDVRDSDDTRPGFAYGVPTPRRNETPCTYRRSAASMPRAFSIARSFRRPASSI